MKETLKHGKTIIPYDIIKSKRRKTSEIIIDDHIIIRTPYGKPLEEIKRIMEDKKQWIFKKQLEFEDKKRQCSKSLYKTSLMYIGKECKLKIKLKQDAEKFSYSKGIFSISLKTEYSISQIKKLYDDWIFKKATGYLPRRLHAISSKIGITPSSVIVKKLKDRWGSAEDNRTINLNSSLLKMPKSVIDYIIIHELCHLKIKGHSFRYWALVEKFMPSYRDHIEWLDRHGGVLLPNKVK